MTLATARSIDALRTTCIALGGFDFMQAHLDALEPYVDPREEFDIETVPSEEEDKLAGPPTYDLLTYPADFTLEVLASKFAAGEIVIPDMQRRYVWNQPQASRLS